MSQYERLAEFLAARKEAEWEATFTDIESLLGFPLPASARKHPAWWANQRNSGHSQCVGWRSVGWRTSGLDLKRKRVRFVRERSGQPYTATARSAHTNPDHLFEQAGELTGIKDRDQLVGEALRALIEREAARRLARLGGTMADFVPPARERP